MENAREPLSYRMETPRCRGACPQRNDRQGRYRMTKPNPWGGFHPGVPARQVGPVAFSPRLSAPVRYAKLAPQKRGWRVL